jgi:putative endonuclease
MHFVYIIYTTAFDKFYIGESIDPIEQVSQNNDGFYKGTSTTNTKDWELKLTLSVESNGDAVKLERYIKSMKSKTFIVKPIADDAFLQEFKQIVTIKFKIEFL